MMPSASVEILYDHYKDTCSIVTSAIAQREKLFLWAFLSMLATLLLTINPDLGARIIVGLGEERLKTSLNITYPVINTALLFVSIWLWIRYFQCVLGIENSYSYIHKLENDITSGLGVEISREGKSYLSNYPIIKSLIHRFYTVVVPLLVLFTAVTKAYYEWAVEKTTIPTYLRLTDTLGILILSAATLLYMSWVHFGDFKKKAS